MKLRKYKKSRLLFILLLFQSMWFGQPVEKCYCLSVGKVSYGREAGAGAGGSVPPVPPGPEAPPTHRLVVHDLRAAWTKPNRDVAFALFDTYMKNKVGNECILYYTFFIKGIFHSPNLKTLHKTFTLYLFYCWYF